MKFQISLVLVFLSASCLVTGKSVTPKDDSFDNYIRAVLDMLRAAMPTGLPDLGIPVLDPFDAPHFDIPHISEGVIELDAAVDNLTVVNLATFETRIVHLELAALSLQIELFIPMLRADAQYFLDGAVFGLLPVFGEGPMFLEIVDLDLNVLAALTLTEDGYVQVGLLDIDANFSNINVHFDNLVGGGDFGEVINMIISTLGKIIWDLVKPSILAEVIEALTGVLNDALSKCSIQDIISGTCDLKSATEQMRQTLTYNF